jgi:hypothetical protein
VEGADGVKTGFTKAAGRILVSSAKRRGRRLVCVTIDDGNDWLDHKTLYDDGFSRYHTKQIITCGQILGTLQVFGGQEDTVDVIAAEDFSFALAKGINIGILDKDTYLPYILKAYRGMCEIALNDEGRLGYVQGVAGWPGPVYPETAMDYACGAFTRLSEELLQLI